MQPIYNNARSNGRAYQAQFGGLNRSPLCADVEFADMGNLSSDRFPYLSPCKQRAVKANKSGIEAVTAPKIEANKTITTFTGVADNKFYYEGTQIYYEGTQTSKITLDSKYAGKRCLVDFNGNILVLPDKQYYSYVDKAGGGIALSVESVSLTFTSSGSVDDSTLKCTISGTGLGVFKSGDALVISGTGTAADTVMVSSKYNQADDDAIVSCVVNSVSGNTLTVTYSNRNGDKVKFPEGGGSQTETGSVVRGVPEILRACVHNNRVFGYDESGERIYASKLGDFRNWYAYEGLSTDGWYSEVGTEGAFTGIAACSMGVVAFKHNYLHLIYGDTPRNFTLQPAIPVGCIDGRSIVDIQGVLFFLSFDGVYAFSGGYPRRVSDALDMRYTEGIAGSDGKKYYLSAKRADGDWELVVYDLARGVWHREDDFHAVGFFRYNDGFYGADSENVYRMDAENYATKWYTESKRYDDGTMENRGLNNLYLRIHAREGSKVEVRAKSGDGDWRLCGSINGPFHGVHRFPVRFESRDSYQYKISGEGHAEIEAIERVLYSGGREER